MAGSVAWIGWFTFEKCLRRKTPLDEGGGMRKSGGHGPVMQAHYHVVYSRVCLAHMCPVDVKASSLQKLEI